MEEIQEVLRQLNLAPSLYGTAIVLAILLRFGRGMIPGFGNPQTYLTAVGLGAVGAILETVEGDGWRDVTKTGLALTAVVLLLQRVLQALAEKVSWLPSDGQWVKSNKEGP